MIALAFLVGGVVGTACAVCTWLFTDLGWSAIIAVYFGIGYGVPLSLLAIAELLRVERPTLPSTDMARR